MSYRKFYAEGINRLTLGSSLLLFGVKVPSSAMIEILCIIIPSEAATWVSDLQKIRSYRRALFLNSGSNLKP